MTWRLGRHLYSRARGEMPGDDVTTNGESDVQRRVIAATGGDKLCVFDIGANQGDWTLPLIDALPRERRERERVQIHLFEPVPTSRKRLEDRLAGAGVTDLAQVHPLAISSSEGQAKLQIVSSTGGRNSLIVGDIPSTDEIVVQTATLPTLFGKLGIRHAQLVKCDAEGHDLAIMQGAAPLLREGRIDVLQFEYNHMWVFSRAFLKDVFDLVQGLPYSVGRIRADSIEVYDAWHPELDRFFHSNYVLVREPALSWFNVRRGSFDISNTYA